MTGFFSAWSSEPAILGEGIIWDGRRNLLLWVDIKRARVFETSPETPGAREWNISGDVGESIGCLAIDPKSSDLIAATGRGIVRLRCDYVKRAARVEVLANPERELIGNRFNDGAIDPLGGFWAGTMDENEEHVRGNWWRWNGLDTELLATGFKISNGPVFIPSSATSFTVFLTDSAKAIVYKAKYSLAHGLSKLDIWAKFDTQQGYPDGMCLDQEGRLWIAFWDGAAIRAYDPSLPVAGPAKETVVLPVRRPTKLAFTPEGDCFVTSASIGIADRVDAASQDGLLIRIDRRCFAKLAAGRE